MTSGLSDDALDDKVQEQFAPKPPERRGSPAERPRAIADRIDDIVHLHCGAYVHREIAAELRALSADIRKAGAP